MQAYIQWMNACLHIYMQAYFQWMRARERGERQTRNRKSKQNVTPPSPWSWSLLDCQPRKTQNHVERHPGVEMVRGLRSDWLWIDSTNHSSIFELMDQSRSSSFSTNHFWVILAMTNQKSLSVFSTNHRFRILFLKNFIFCGWVVGGWREESVAVPLSTSKNLWKSDKTCYKSFF